MIAKECTNLLKNFVVEQKEDNSILNLTGNSSQE